MPDVRHVTGKQRPSLGPVGSVIVADLAHPIRVIHAGALPPLGVVLNTIGLIRQQQRGFNGTQHARDSLLVGRVTAQ
jgi:hypothetical protein